MIDSSAIQNSHYENTANKSLLRRIKRLNNKLNSFNYGVVVDGQVITDDSEIESVFEDNLYRTLSCREFVKYRTGVCWDYTHYEALYFMRRLGFEIVKDDWLRFDKTFSMYYMEFEDDDGDTPTHTWLAFRLNGKVYSFESSWKPYAGVKAYPGEFSMIKEYLQRQEDYYAGMDIKIHNPSIYKYEPLIPGLDCGQFMREVKKERQINSFHLNNF